MKGKRKKAQPPQTPPLPGQPAQRSREMAENDKLLSSGSALHKVDHFRTGPAPPAVSANFFWWLSKETRRQNQEQPRGTILQHPKLMLLN